jgi:hypothetical protein
VNAYAVVNKLHTFARALGLSHTHQVAELQTAGGSESTCSSRGGIDVSQSIIHTVSQQEGATKKGGQVGVRRVGDLVASASATRIRLRSCTLLAAVKVPAGVGVGNTWRKGKQVNWCPRTRLRSCTLLAAANVPAMLIGRASAVVNKLRTTVHALRLSHTHQVAQVHTARPMKVPTAAGTG